jgi:hypothetical protein
VNAVVLRIVAIEASAAQRGPSGFVHDFEGALAAQGSLEKGGECGPLPTVLVRVLCPHLGVRGDGVQVRKIRFLQWEQPEGIGFQDGLKGKWRHGGKMGSWNHCTASGRAMQLGMIRFEGHLIGWFLS